MTVPPSDYLAELRADASDLVIGPERMREIETEGSVSWEAFKRELGLEDVGAEPERERGRGARTVRDL